MIFLGCVARPGSRKSPLSCNVLYNTYHSTHIDEPVPKAKKYIHRKGIRRWRYVRNNKDVAGVSILNFWSEKKKKREVSKAMYCAVLDIQLRSKTDYLTSKKEFLATRRVGNWLDTYFDLSRSTFLGHITANSKYLNGSVWDLPSQFNLATLSQNPPIHLALSHIIYQTI